MSQSLSNTNFPVIKLKSGRDRSVRNRHPWVFSGGIHESRHHIADGTIVEIQSASDEPLAWGHWSGKSSIVCRLFEFAPYPKNYIHTDDYWFEKFRSAYELRKSLLDFSHTNMYRLINAEGDHLPGMIVDIYPETAVIQLRTAGMRKVQKTLAQFLKDELHINNILLKEDKSEGESAQHRWLNGNLETGEITAMENGLNFIVQPETGQKTGFFIDQRFARMYAGSLARGRKVLNAFAYTGGFSLYALRGGAEEVVSVDISDSACMLCDRNIALNFGETAVKHETITADCFDYLRHIYDDYFDMIILDPPAFTKHINTVQQASRGYKDINLKAMNKIRKGGILLTFSCSQHISTDLFRKIIFAAAADANRSVRIINQLTHPEDHPINIYHPEGEYLKGLALFIE